MNKVDKGLLFFYDWEECFDALPEKDFKEIFMAMLRFKKYGTPPPKFEGITKMAASLIFPQLERQITDYENGKKGGRPKKSSTINKEDFHSTSNSNNVIDELMVIAARRSAALRAERARKRAT